MEKVNQQKLSLLMVVKFLGGDFTRVVQSVKKTPKKTNPSLLVQYTWPEKILVHF